MDERRHPANRPTEPDDPAGDDERRLGLAELAEAAGVSVRTVRYYIAEGLLPPPEGAGPRSAYTPGHLDRLRLIARLKDAYLPLREIRRRLDGLADAEVRAALTRLGPPSAPKRRRAPASQAAAAEGPEPPDSPADYLARVMRSRPQVAAPPRAPLQHPAPAGPLTDRPVGLPPARPEQHQETEGFAFAALASARPEPALPAAAEEDRPPPPPSTTDAVAERSPPAFDLDLDPALALDPPEDEPEATAAEGPWRRICLGPDAELLVREDAYQRRQERIAWLIGWARKVFG